MHIHHYVANVRGDHSQPYTSVNVHTHEGAILGRSIAVRTWHSDTNTASEERHIEKRDQVAFDQTVNMAVAILNHANRVPGLNVKKNVVKTRKECSI